LESLLSSASRSVDAVDDGRGAVGDGRQATRKVLVAPAQDRNLKRRAAQG
jgi:hypothetical protein